MVLHRYSIIFTCSIAIIASIAAAELFDDDALASHSIFYDNPPSDLIAAGEVSDFGSDQNPASQEDIFLGFPSIAALDDGFACRSFYLSRKKRANEQCANKALLEPTLLQLPNLLELPTVLDESMQNTKPSSQGQRLQLHQPALFPPGNEGSGICPGERMENLYTVCDLGAVTIVSKEEGYDTYMLEGCRLLSALWPCEFKLWCCLLWYVGENAVGVGRYCEEAIRRGISIPGQL
jgi:hypothetical protein